MYIRVNIVICNFIFTYFYYFAFIIIKTNTTLFKLSLFILDYIITYNLHDVKIFLAINYFTSVNRTPNYLDECLL